MGNVVDVTDSKVGELELDAFFKSGYRYEDAERLAWFWGQTIVEAKSRIGRKVKWRNEKVLDSMLYNARGQWNWIRESPYIYQDAEALATFWGVSTEEAKVIGGHKIQGYLVLNQALAEAATDTRMLTYTVQRGDSLSGIAANFSTSEFEVTVEMLLNLNPDTIDDPNLIFPGQVLQIPWGWEGH